MAYQVYWGAGSPYSWRVLLALELLDIKYQSNLLEFSKSEHKSDAMLAMNPRGRLPVLKDAEVSVYESIAILTYINSKHPDRGLFGSTPAETGFIWQRIFEIENYLCQQINGIVRPVFFDEVDNNIELIKQSAVNISAEFKILESNLEKTNYVAGDKITAADIALLPFVKVLLRALELEAGANLNLGFTNFENNYPHINNWLRRIEVLPGYDNSYPPNWKE